MVVKTQEHNTITLFKAFPHVCQIFRMKKLVARMTQEFRWSVTQNSTDSLVHEGKFTFCRVTWYKFYKEQKYNLWPIFFS